MKLENILINDVAGMNLIKLIDFGFATACQKEVRLTLYCGTLWYMDPDLAKGRKY
jgi:serine/threonine protein kinase